MSNPLPVAILAGGLATRLRPITEKIPKSLVAVAGRPFLSHQIELLRSQGVQRLVLCVGHLGEMIQQEYGNGSQYGIRIDYSFDGDQLLGTGGAVRKALPLLGQKFFVLYGDSYLPIDYQAVGNAFELSGRPALMTVYANEGRYDTSNVWFENGQIKVYDKKSLRPQMRHIDYGLSAFSASVFQSISTGTRMDLADILSTLAARGELAGFEVFKRFYEIGSPAGLAELDNLLAAGKSPTSSALDSTQPSPSASMTYTDQHIRESLEVLNRLNHDSIEKLVNTLAAVRERGGRLFILGVGGSAANASHAVNDFRKIAGFEAYAPTDNVSELTARTNDEGWASVFVEWLRGSRLNNKDGVFVFSVGGGNLEKNVSPNLVSALKLAKEVGATVMGVVGRDGGYTAQVADACVIIPTVNPDNVTPHSEAFQGVVWHLLVSHPKIKTRPTKWETTR